VKVSIVSHHFPPRYNAGAEQYAYRLAHWLKAQGHAVEVVCVESVAQGDLVPRCEEDRYEGLLVHRLYFDLSKAANPLELRFRNPYLGNWVKEYLARFQPDLVHFNSGYLIGGAVIEAAHALGIPSVLTLHEYWFLCPTHTLIHADGALCERPCPAAQCAWELLLEKRRYRAPERWSGGRLGRVLVGLAGVKLVAQLAGLQPVIETVQRRRAYLARVLTLPDVVLSPSKFLIHKFADFGMAQREICYAPFGLDTSHLMPEPARPASRFLQVGYLGQYAAHKGVHLLVEAVARANQGGQRVQLNLYGRLSGTGRYETELLRSFEGRDDIRYHGGYDNARVGEILSSLDVMVVPSVWYENRPTVIVEAQAMRVPVVASRIGGIPELIEDGVDGFLFTPGNVEELTAVLQRFVDDPGLASRLRANTRPVMSIEAEMAQTLSFYQTAVQSGNSGCAGSILSA
jgi:glycosyltransferase involved in cell wall biosynthesis